MAVIETEIDLSILEKFGDVDRILTMIEPHISRALSIIQGAVKERTPTGASGDLKRAIGFKFDRDTSTGSVYVSPGLAPATYAQFVEYGRLPGKMPPWSEGTPLYEWVRHKVTTASYNATGKVLKKTPDREKMILSISFLIARSIAKKGTYRSSYSPDGSPHMFELGWADSRDMALDIINDGISKVLATI